jgi:acetate kinase
MDGIPQVAVFDTAFHQTMPEKAYLYALPYEYYEKHGVRRYGFHGTSHRYVSQKAAEIVGKPAEDLKIIVCHLGNGSSISAVNGGKCIDTSMGLTPLEGVPMGTRSGCIDPAILEFIMNAESIDISEMTDILNKKSGVLGISGISSDFRDLDEAKDNGHKRAIIALECFAYSVKKYIGAYVAALGGLDILVFTAGIGENNYKARKEITSGLEFMGISIDDEKNINNQTDISAEGSRVRTLVVPTNEELAIAIDTMALVEKLVK